MGPFGKPAKAKCCRCGYVCCGRCLPLNCFTGEVIVGDNCLPLTLTVDLTATPSFGGSTCFDGSGTLTFATALTGGTCSWEGRIEGDCIDCNGNSFHWIVDMVVGCGDDGWGVSASVGAPCVMGEMGSDAAIVPATCDPVLFEGCFEAEIVGCVVACLDTMPPTPGPIYTLCFSIYETP